MIAQVLNRRFVLDQLEDIKAHLEGLAAGGDEQRRGEAIPEGAEGLTGNDYSTTLELVSESIDKEAKASTGQIGFEQPEEDRRRGEEAPSMDDSSFFSRDPVISNLQSALEEYFETQQPDALIEAPSEENDRRRGEADPPAAAELSLDGYKPKRDEDGRRVFEKFSVTDPGWISSAVAMAIRQDKHKFVDRPATPLAIADRTRIIMVGDWGSGIPRAQKVAGEMRRVIEEGKAQGLQQHVIHLGDVYYSGWKREVKKRFLEYWPVRSEEKHEISSWCLINLVIK